MATSPDVIVDGITVPGAMIDTLRLMVGTTPLTNDQLAQVLVTTRDEDGSWNINRAAATVWRQKAATYAELVNVSESGSSRALGDLYKNALSMAAQYDTETALVVGPARSRTREITRPSAS